MKTPREADILKQCLDYLTLFGAFVWRQNQGGVKAEYQGRKRFFRFASATGVSDIIGVLPGGRLVAVETKRPGKRPSPEQAAFLDRVNRCGGLGVCVHSLDELREALRLEGVTL